MKQTIRGLPNIERYRKLANVNFPAIPELKFWPKSSDCPNYPILAKAKGANESKVAQVGNKTSDPVILTGCSQQFSKLDFVQKFFFVGSKFENF